MKWFKIAAAALLVSLVAGCDSGTVAPRCGNGILEGNEECDGSQFGPYTCEWFGFAGGELSCSSECTLDYSRCDGFLPSCGNGLAEQPEQCDGSDLAGATCESLGYDGGTLGCKPACVYDTSGCEGCVRECMDEGARRCSQDGSSVEVCTRDGQCLHWVSHPCLYGCDESERACRVCEDACPVGSQRCHDGWVQTCALQDGCPSWKGVQLCPEDTECVESSSSDGTVAMCAEPCEDECDPGQILGCVDHHTQLECAMAGDGCYHPIPSSCGNGEWCLDSAGCTALGSGESCDDPMVVESLPFVLSGTNFATEFTSDATYLHTLEGCTDATPTFGGDLFLALHLGAQESIAFWEEDSRAFSEYTLLVMEDCSPTGACLAGVFNTRDPLLRFTAPHDATYILVVVRPFTSSSDYSVHIDFLHTLSEGDDCDPEGVLSVCAEGLQCRHDEEGWRCTREMETCRDGQDNDGDGLSDCDDPDCAAAQWCM